MFDTVREAAGANGVFNLTQSHDLHRAPTRGIMSIHGEVTISVCDSGIVADLNPWSVIVTDEHGGRDR